MSTRVLIIGAGEAGRMLQREFASQGGDEYCVVGFLDDDTGVENTAIAGIPVVAGCDRLPEVVADLSVDEVIIAVPSAEGQFIRRMIRLCRDAAVPFRIVPGLLEIIKGPVHMEQIRDMRPQDLLGRESVEFDEATISDALRGRTVLVTGAGGSIGGEICRQIGRFDLENLILLGRGENQIYEIERDIRDRYPDLQTVSVIADIRDSGAIKRVFGKCQPHFVYHAAAHKHVHYMEAFPDEAVKNNIVGTSNVIEAAAAAGVDRVVMLSTDKAVDPEGVMGATKRFAEYLMTTTNSGTTRFITVRFGNVLASRGSVVPLFIRQIRAGGPVTVSHEDATRFFMSLKEACMLVVQASLMGKGGEIYILQMGEPIRIIELAKDLIALHGLKPDVDIPIQITGLRPGEKLHESLIAHGEQTETSDYPYILSSGARSPSREDIGAAYKELRELADLGDIDGIRRVLDRVIPEAHLGAVGSEGN